MGLEGTEFRGTERFTLTRQLGRGGMGVVYAAIDKHNGARVALKTLNNVSARALLRFKKEFRAVQDVQHPNLVLLGELIEADGQWFMTMEHVPGGHILDYVRGRTDARATDPTDDPDLPEPLPFDEGRLRSAMGQLASALASLHDANLVHRDVKPSNVLVTPEDRVVLLDFGLIAETEVAEVGTGSDLVGTAAYMAPEQAASRPIGPAADWYSFGTILYEALTGAVPFTGPVLKVVMDKQQLAPVSPDERVAGLPQDLSRLCMELLRFDPAERPSGRRVLEVLGVTDLSDGAARSAATLSEGGRFVGRRAELDVLREAFTDLNAGLPICVALAGPSGQGKTALVRRFTRDLQMSDESALVMWGRCYERESVPFKAFDGIVDSLARVMLDMPKHDARALVHGHAALLPMVFPVLSHVEVIAKAPLAGREPRDPLELRSRAFSALRELLTRLALHRTLVLVIDDVHWADADSLHLLAELLRPPGAPPMLVLATTRRPMSDLASLPCETRVLGVGPLSEEDATELAARLLERAGNEHGEGAAHVATEAQGHPMYIEEMVVHSATAGASSAANFRLDAAIWARAQSLPPDARLVLELVAIAGLPLPQETIRVAAEQTPAEFFRHVSILRAAKLTRTSSREREPAIAPYHDRVREAVQGHVEDRARVARHERLAVALELSPQADQETKAVHLLASGQRDAARVAYESAATRAAETLAFGRAARLYRCAIDLYPDDTPLPHALHRAFGDVLRNAGRGPEAAAAYLRAVEGAPPAEQVKLQHMASAQLLESGHVEEGLQQIELFLRSVDLQMAPTPRSALRQFLMLRLRVRARGYRFVERQECDVPASQLARIDVAEAVGRTLGFVVPMQASCFQARSLLLALEAGEPQRVATALISEASYASIAGRKGIAHTTRALAAAKAIAERHPTPGLRASIVGASGVIALHMGRFQNSFDDCVTAETMYVEECTGYRWELSTVRIFQGFALNCMGRIGEALERLPALIRDALDRGDLYAATTLETTIGFYEELCADRSIAAQDKLDRALDRWSHAGYHLQHANALRTRMTIAMYAQDYERAHASCEAAWPAIRRAHILRAQLLGAQFWDIRGRAAIAHAMRCGSADAMAVARKAAKQLTRQRADYVDAMAHLLRAGIAYTAGDDRRALAFLEQSEALATAADLGATRLAARYARGRILAGDEGHELVADALAGAQTEGFVNPQGAMNIWVPWVDARDSPS